MDIFNCRMRKGKEKTRREKARVAINARDPFNSPVDSHVLPFTWKVMNAPRSNYALKDAFNSKMYKMTRLGAKEYNRIHAERTSKK